MLAISQNEKDKYFIIYIVFFLVVTMVTVVTKHYNLAFSHYN